MINKIVYVILHYHTMEDTIECVDSIQNNVVDTGRHIVIVDNGSTNRTGKQLIERYKEDDTIDVLLSDTNLGFANGNNIGIVHALKEHHAEYVVVINNDTVIKQDDFEKQIDKIYKKTNFSVLGPNIISLIDGGTQNPVPYALRNKTKVRKRMLKFKVLQWLVACNGDLLLTKNDKNKIPEIQEMDDYQLHGCCLILSKAFTSVYQGLCNQTFMYCEEDILKQQCINHKMLMLYDNTITIYHKEGSSTSASINTDKQKRKFYYKNTYHSLKALYKLMG